MSDAELDLVTAARRLLDLVRTMDAPGSDADAARSLVEEASALLEPHRWDGPYMQGHLKDATGDMSSLDPAVMFPYSPVVGPRTPFSPPVSLSLVNGHMVGTMRLGAPYAGPPSTVHGGVVALVFDELLGVTNVAHGLGAMTGTLNIRYQAPTPLDHDVALDAWIDRVEGRKVHTHGTMTHDGVVTAIAEGIFILARTDDQTPPAPA